MKLLIIGASSYVGAKLYIDLKEKYDVAGTYNSNKLFESLHQLDLTNAEAISTTITDLKPDVIIHVAAIPNIAGCEKNPALAKVLNEDSVKHVAEIAEKIKSKIVYISSFPGLLPNDPYWKTKAVAEEFVRKTNNYVILRPCLVVGYSPNIKNDRPFNRLIKNILEQTPAVYDDSWKFPPTYLHHVSEVISSIINKNIVNETIHVATDALKSRYDLAKDILSPFGIDVKKKDGQKLETPYDLSKLKRLGLQEYSYEDVVKNIIQEIKDNVIK